MKEKIMARRQEEEIMARRKASQRPGGSEHQGAQEQLQQERTCLCWARVGPWARIYSLIAPTLDQEMQDIPLRKGTLSSGVQGRRKGKNMQQPLNQGLGDHLSLMPPRSQIKTVAICTGILSPSLV